MRAKKTLREKGGASNIVKGGIGNSGREIKASDSHRGERVASNTTSFISLSLHISNKSFTHRYLQKTQAVSL